MTTIKRKTYRVISLLVAFLVFFSAFTTMYLTTLSLGDQMRIVDFSVDYVSGSTLTNGIHIWTPQTSDPGHIFAYSVNFSLSGNGEFDPGEISITLPKQILKNRNGDYADILEMSIPSLEEAEAYSGSAEEIDKSFVFYINGTDVIIKNYEKISAGMTKYIEVGYAMSLSTLEYRDMDPSDDFSASIKIMNGEKELESRSAVAGPVYIDTGASVLSTAKKCQNIACPYDEWQNEWGEAPENAENYYYLVWEVRSYIGDVTQPYTFTLDDVVTEADAEPAAYKFWGINDFRTENYIHDCRTGRVTRYDYVITKHLKETYQRQNTYTLHNKAVVTVTPTDGIDEDTSASAEAEFLYKPVFAPPEGSFTSRKAGNSNWWQIFNQRWEVADYGLNDLQDGNAEYLDSNIKFRLESWAFPYPLTVISDDVGDDLNDIIDSYGKRNVRMVLTDEDFYFNDGIYENSDRNMVISDTDVKIGCEDYSIEYVDYSIDMKDADFDKISYSFTAKDVTLTESDVISFYGKFGGNEEWVLAGTYDMYNDIADYNPAYVNSLTDDRIEFTDNCTAYKIEAVNAHYYTYIDAYPYCRIKNSDYIMAQSAGKERVWLTNVSNFSVYDDSDTLAFSQDSHATDFIVGVQKQTEIEKSMVSKTDNNLKRYIELKWRVDMSEYYITNYGKQYVSQDSGVFYDLLPIGLEPDLSTVTVYDGINSYLNESGYEVSKIQNYNNTGRTMLIVKIKEQFETASIVYDTIYSWDDAVNYGTMLLNSAAYQTGNEKITNGRADNGGDIAEGYLLADIDPDNDDERFLYTEREYEVTFLVAVTTALDKRVKSENDLQYKKETTVYRDSIYRYKLSYTSSPNSRAKDIILYDRLEAYSDENVSSQWKGTLQYVDTAQLRMQDIAPVVYYSTFDLAELNENTSLDDTINGERVWVPASEILELEDVKALAVDISKKTDGSDFILEENKSVVAVVYMRAPMFDMTDSEDPVTYNNVYLDATAIDELENEEPYFIDYGYTTVHFRIASSFGIIKTDANAPDTTVKDISFTLSGVSDYGTEVNLTLTSDREGRLMFENIERGTYTLMESRGSEDYLPIDTAFEVVIDGFGNVLINGTEVENHGFYYIGDDPRVHADIEFIKRNITKKTSPVSGAEFLLTGTSNYGNNITRKAVADEKGKVSVKNIEWGTYELREVNILDGYIPNDTVYSVTVDSSGNSFINIDTEHGAADYDTLYKAINGVYYIYNEPYHSFTVQKLGQSYGMPVSGAVFALEGNSDRGVYCYQEKTTQSSGRVSFSGLEAGIYTLTELSAPEGYALDDTVHIVTITKDGTITISNSEVNNVGHFVITNKENSTIKVVKIWRDNETNETRTAEPVINLRTDVPVSAAYFSGNGDYSILSTLTGNTGNINSFTPFSGDEEEVRRLIESQKAVRIDDKSTEYSIYAWLESDTGAVRWWSDAKTVYLTDKGKRLWYRLGCETIDVTGIDTSKLTSMDGLFSECWKLKYLDLTSFDTSNVTDMSSMFYNCHALSGVNLSSFDTSNVESMSYMFYNCSSLQELDLSSFDTKNVTAMANMFMYCSSLSSLDLSAFNTQNVSVVSYYETNGRQVEYGGMFKGCSALTELDLSSFDTSSVKSMNSMFSDCASLTSLDLSSFDTSNVSEMNNMFSGCISLTILDLSTFDTSGVISMSGMFHSCTSLTKIFASELWSTENVISGIEMFTNDNDLVGGAGTHYYDSLDDFEFARIDEYDPEGLLTYKQQDVSYENAAYFSGNGNLSVLSRLTALSNIRSFTHFDGSQDEVQTLYSGGEAIRIDDRTTIYKIYAWFNSETGTVSWWSDADTVYLTNKGNTLWKGLTGCISIDLSGIDTSRLINMSGLFSSCSSLKELDLSLLDTSNTENMSEMFLNCTSLTELDLSSFDTGSTTNMSGMFNSCSSLTSIRLSSFDTTSVVSMQKMFYGCSSLTEINLSSFNTWSVNDMSGMFSGCTSLMSLTFTNPYTGRVISMENMFSGCTRLTELDLSSFDTSNVTNMSGMFSNCSALKTIWVSDLWTTESVITANGMFTGDKSLKGGNGTEYSSKRNSKTYARIDSAEKIGYMTYKQAGKKWTVYTSDDENCTLNKESSSKWTYTFTELVPGLTYFAYEDELEGYASANMGAEHSIKVVGGQVTITNETLDYNAPVYGRLKVSKTVIAGEGAELTEADTQRKFAFKVTLTDENGEAPDGTELHGTVIFRNGKADLYLSHGESITIPIREGWSYKIDEIPVNGFTAEGKNTSGVIMENTESASSFVNTKIVTNEDNVSFRLRKIVTGNFENDMAYVFNIVFSGLRENETYYITDSNNVQINSFTSDGSGSAYTEVTLRNGEELTVNSIPNNSTYTVTEEAGDYISSYIISDENNLGLIKQSNGANTVKNKLLSTGNETADKGENVTVTFTNKKDVRQDLTLKKVVDGNYDNEMFKFTIEITGLSPNEVLATSSAGKIKADENGKIAFELNMKNGETTVLYSLPVGASYRITEHESSYAASYKMTDTNNLGKINNAFAQNVDAGESLSTETETVNEGENITVTFTNVQKKANIIITKIWKDNETNTTRTARPVINLIYEDNEQDTSSNSNSSQDTEQKKQYHLTSDDSSCILTMLNNRQWTYTFTDVPAGLDYYVWEGELDGYSSNNMGEDNKTSVVNNNAIITNISPDYKEPDYGSLKISKSVAAADGVQLKPSDTTRKFSFSITLFDQNGELLSGTEMFNTVVFRQGKAVIRLAHNESFILTSIPEGYSYKVEEADNYGFEAYTESNEGTIEASEISEVKYVNTRLPQEPEKISFKLKKIVTGNYELETDYRFTIRFTGLQSKISYKVTDSEGETVKRFTSDEKGNAEAALMLSNGEELTVNNIPEGATYIITEAAGRYTSSYEITDANSIGLIAKVHDSNTEESKSLSTAVETADLGEDISIVFTNHKDIRQDLTLEKRTLNTAITNTDSFQFTVELYGLSSNEEISTDAAGKLTADSSGKIIYELSMKSDEKIVFYKLPVGTEYKITESANDYVSSYVLTDSNNLNKIVSGNAANDVKQKPLSTALERVNEGENVTVEFTNDKQQHDLTIRKNVDMSDGNLPYAQYSNQLFIFTVSFTGLDSSKRYYMEYIEADNSVSTDGEYFESSEDGNAELSFCLKHGQSLRIKDLTKGAVYKITESAASNYVASYSIVGNDNAVIANKDDSNTATKQSLSTQSESLNQNNHDMVVTFTNKFEPSDYILPAAGFDDMKRYLMPVFVCMILFSAIFGLSILRKRENTIIDK